MLATTISMCVPSKVSGFAFAKVSGDAEAHATVSVHILPDSCLQPRRP